MNDRSTILGIVSPECKRISRTNVDQDELIPMCIVDLEHAVRVNPTAYSTKAPIQVQINHIDPKARFRHVAVVVLLLVVVIVLAVCIFCCFCCFCCSCCSVVINDCRVDNLLLSLDTFALALT